ncbi:MAG: hypothetical protein K0S04_3621 [Herbinix sp.]|nr:hypothetical protein [Herbinix sp.]
MSSLQLQHFGEEFIFIIHQPQLKTQEILLLSHDVQCVEVHFERPTEEGFDAARCSWPTYTWIKREGFTDKEIEKFERFLHSNAHLLYKYAASGGIKIA